MSFSSILFFSPKPFFILKKDSAPDTARFLSNSCLQTGQDFSTQMTFKTRYLASVNFQFQDIFLFAFRKFLTSFSVHIYTLISEIVLQHNVMF